MQRQASVSASKRNHRSETETLPCPYPNPSYYLLAVQFFMGNLSPIADPLAFNCFVAGHLTYECRNFIRTDPTKDVHLDHQQQFTLASSPGHSPPKSGLVLTVCACV